MKRVFVSLTALFVAQASGGDFNLSPTIESTMYVANVESDNDSLKREDTITFNKLSLLGEYSSVFFNSALNLDYYDVKYSDFSEGDTSYLEYDWSSEILLLDENLKFESEVSRKLDHLNSVRSSFSDRVYNLDTSRDLDAEKYVATYRFPSAFLLNGNVGVSYETSETTEDYSNASNDITSKNAFVDIGQTGSDDPIYWNVSSNVGESTTTSGLEYQSSNADGVIRVPVSHDFYLVSLGNYSEHKTPAQKTQNRSTKPIRYSMYGFGIGWYSKVSENLLQITAERDNERGTFTPGAMFQLKTSEKSILTGKFTQRFYGDSGSFSYKYESERAILDIGYAEDVGLRYAIQPTVINEGLYVCSDVTEFDSDACFLPPDANYELVEGDRLIPKTSIEYPLVERLTLSKNTYLNWGYKRDFWGTQLHAYNQKQDEINENYTQETNSISFELTQRLSDTNSMKYEAKYKETDIQPYDYGIEDMLYKVSFEQELNSRASWSMGAQMLEKKASNGDISFTDYRVFGSYKHHFGEKNKFRREP